MIGTPNDSSFSQPLGALAAANALFAQSNERLATGLRINSAKDDPAGLIASEAISSDIVSNQARARAIDRATFTSNIEDGALRAASDISLDINATVIAAASTFGQSPNETNAFTKSLSSTINAVQSIVDEASPGLLDDVEVQKQTGTDPVTGDPVYETYTLSDLPELVETDPELAQDLADQATSAIATRRAEIGAEQQGDAAIQRSSETERINLERARSTIRDTDYAKQVSEQTRAGILSQSSMLALRMSMDVSKNVLDLFA